MPTMDITVKVSKNTYEIGEGLSEFVGAVRQALADGWQPTEDIPEIVTSAIKDLAPQIEKFDDAVAEVGEDKVAWGQALALALGKMASQFV